MSSLPRSFALVLGTLAAVAAAAAPARAETGVGVVVTGEATMQPQLAAQLETWLRTHGHALVSAPLPPDAINTLIDCFVMEDQNCARKVIEKRAKSAAVVFAQVNVTAGATALDRTVTLTAYWLAQGKDAIVERRFCERCTDVTLRGTADELMAALAGAGSDRGRIKITSTPAGAKVVIDGKSIGLTPLDYSLSLGEHSISLEAEGRIGHRRRVTIAKGTPVTVDVTLDAVPVKRSKLPFLVAGVGAGLLVSGGLLVAIDEDVRSDGPQQREYFDSAAGGVALMVTGAAVAGAGVYLYLRGRARGAPTAALLPGGGSVGWAGRF